VDVVDSEYSDLIKEIHSLQSSSSSSSSASRGNQNDFQAILRIHKKFLANILKLSMIDHLGIQETIDRILFICLRFIACVRIQSDHENPQEGSSGSVNSPRAEESYVFIPVEEYSNIQNEFFLQISFLFQTMKTLDSRGFLFRLDFNNYLSNQIMEMFHKSEQERNNTNIYSKSTTGLMTKPF
jgi:hypothetical protein